ncbi:MAG: hypothetical protein L3J23_09270 [Flavobacteriaceae bacterium]|nr:hypothetical protein [Flavobacteriaceae bacterium]
MKQFIYKIISSILAFIVLLASFSFTINKHFCGGKVANATLFISANNCGMDMQACENISKNKTIIQKEPCCQDTSELIQGNENNQQAHEFQLNIPQVQFLTAFVYTYISSFNKESTTLSYSLYEPPLVYKKIQTLFQIFRI